MYWPKTLARPSLNLVTWNVGYESGYGQALYPVTEWGSGVQLARWGEGGAPAHIVGEMRSGAIPVMFENGPPPGSPAAMLEQMHHQAMAWVATMAARSQMDFVSRGSIASGPSAADLTRQRLLLLFQPVGGLVPRPHPASR
jgi:hypothetical protein